LIDIALAGCRLTHRTVLKQQTLQCLADTLRARGSRPHDAERAQDRSAQPQLSM
jgi:hypothetical protein